MKRFLLIFSFVLLGTCLMSDAQNLRCIKQNVSPAGIDMCAGSIAYWNDKDVYTPFPSSRLVGSTKYPISQLKVTPDGKAVAVVCGKADVSRIFVYALKEDGDLLHAPKTAYKPVSVCYSPDGKTVAIADSEGSLHLMDSCFRLQKFSANAGFAPADMIWNPDGQSLVLYKDSKFKVISADDGSVIKESSVSGKINDAEFTSDGKSLAVLVSDGNLVCYDAETFAETSHIGNLGDASSMALYSEKGYAAVVSAPGTILFASLSSPDTVHKYETDGKNITDILSMYSFDGNPVLCFVVENNFWKDDVSSCF